MRTNDNISGRSAVKGGVGAELRHDSAHKHVTGAAIYTDDAPEPPGTLHVHIATSERAHAAITRMDLSAVGAQPGVVAVLSVGDIPGVNDVSPIAGDDPMFADGLVEYYGQSLFVVAAESLEEARAAAAHAEIDYEERPALLTVDQAMEAKSFLGPPYTMQRGDAASAIAAAPHHLAGRR